MRTLKEKSVRTVDLTDECFLVQIFGLIQCVWCEWLDTRDCGGEKTRKLITDGLFPKDGLPSVEKRELDDERFKALEQMVENAKDDPLARSELVNKLF